MMINGIVSRPASRFSRAALGGLLLLVAGLLPGCRSTPGPELKLAQVTVPAISGGALREMIGLHMRAHDWYLTRQEPGLLVYERRVVPPLKAWLDNEARTPVVLQTEITLTRVSDGVRLQAATQRIDASKVPPRQTAESPKEMQQILEEVRHGAGGG